MPQAKHVKAAALVRSQFFAGLTSFAELEQRTAALPDEQARGVAFEVFAEAYLATQRKHDAAQVWPHGSVPLDLLKNLGLTQQDMGVDGVLQTLLGEFDAYQVKFRTGRPALTWRELSTFIGLADSPQIHSRVLLTNCDELPAVLNDRQGFFCIRGSDLDRLEAGDFRAIEDWLAGAAFVALKKSPQPHQTEALDALLPALQTHDRVSAIMACGTGKTLVALWVAESVAQAVGSREATPRKLASHEVAGNVPANFPRPEGTPDFHRPVRTDSVLGGEPDTSCLANVQCPVGTNAASVAQASSPAGSGGVSPPVGEHAPGRCFNPDSKPRFGPGTAAPRILILLPSLALLRQTLHEWLRETRLPSLAYLCVCSDPTVKEGIDALTTQQSDLDFQVSTDAASVRHFLDAPFAGVKMIFATYQSASVVGAALQAGAPNSDSAFLGMATTHADLEIGAPAPPAFDGFDLGIFDEAHKTAGREGRNFAFALDDKNLPIRKRLFLTATPRHYNPHDRDREGEARLLFSMDNPAVYGPQAYRLTFAEAARRGIICGYKVIISVITSEMVTNELLSHGEVLVNGDAVRARQVANQIALRDAIEKYGVKKVFTFHRDVKSAQSFVSAGPEGVGTHLNGGAGFQPAGSSGVPAASPETAGGDARPTRTQDACATFQTFHVNGSMPAARRERELRDFRAAARAVVSNARCLTEGVDVPAVDMVAFLSPRRSRVDIVQATGRAMRRSPGKSTGYVLVPLYVEQDGGETIGQAIERTEFDEVWQVLQSLQEQDDVLAETISRIRENRGRGRAPDDYLGDCVDICGPTIWLEVLQSAITTKCVDALSSSWHERYGQLKAYRELTGGSLANDFRTASTALGSKAYLELIGNPVDAKDGSSGLNLQEWIATQPPAKQPYYCRTLRLLSDWSKLQRYLKRAGRLPEDRISKLNAIGFAWEIMRNDWEEMFAELKSFRETHGHCDLKNEPDGKFVLQSWLENQSRLFANNQLAKDRTERLKLLGVVFDFKPQKPALNVARELMFSRLVAYKAKFGDCDVTKDFHKFVCLGRWVSRQRKLRSAGKLEATFIERLDHIGFIWDRKEYVWRKMYLTIRRHLNSVGPSGLELALLNDEALNKWVIEQQLAKQRGVLDQHKQDELDRLGFHWDTWDRKDFLWRRMFLALRGHLDSSPPGSLNEVLENNTELGRWIKAQQEAKSRGVLDQQKQTELDKIGFPWNFRRRPKAALKPTWDDMFAKLANFHQLHGHCDVKIVLPLDIQLHKWAQEQRWLKPKRRLTRDKIHKLDALGFIWNTEDLLWERMFKLLLAYKSAHGDCDVPGYWQQNYELSNWVASQRKQRNLGKLMPSHIERLNQIGFLWGIT